MQCGGQVPERLVMVGLWWAATGLTIRLSHVVVFPLVASLVMY